MAKIRQERLIDNKLYRLVKKYPNFSLWEDIRGIKTCFDDFDLGLIEHKYIEQKDRYRKYE